MSHSNTSLLNAEKQQQTEQRSRTLKLRLAVLLEGELANWTHKPGTVINTERERLEREKRIETAVQQKMVTTTTTTTTDMSSPLSPGQLQRRRKSSANLLSPTFVGEVNPSRGPAANTTLNSNTATSSAGGSGGGGGNNGSSGSTGGGGRGLVTFAELDMAQDFDFTTTTTTTGNHLHLHGSFHNSLNHPHNNYNNNTSIFESALEQSQNNPTMMASSFNNSFFQSSTGGGLFSPNHGVLAQHNHQRHAEYGSDDISRAAGQHDDDDSAPRPQLNPIHMSRHHARCESANSHKIERIFSLLVLERPEFDPVGVARDLI